MNPVDAMVVRLGIQIGQMEAVIQQLQQANAAQEEQIKELKKAAAPVFKEKK